MPQQKSNGNATNNNPFSQVPEKTACVMIFRVEKFKIIPVPHADWGKFYTGDAYIVYAANEYKRPITIDDKPQPARASIEQRIHFWLGSKCTLDEAGTAAFKTVELDEQFGGLPVQYRETQEHESRQFLSYFPYGIRYLEGGAESGFTQVSQENKSYLYLVKGKKNIRLQQLPSVKWEHFNDGDVYVLDTNQRKAVFVWCGKESNRMERMAASQAASKMADDNGAGAHVTVINSGHEETDLHGLDREVWEELLPLAQRKVKGTGGKLDAAAESDADFDKTGTAKVHLYRLHEDDTKAQRPKVAETTRVEMTEIAAGGALKKSMLESGDTFVVDEEGHHQVFVWQGKKATPQERVAAMIQAQNFARQRGYDLKDVQIIRITEGTEDMVPEFSGLFK